MRTVDGHREVTVNYSRISSEELCFSLAVLVSERSTCPRLHVGAVIVDPDGRIISTGYNGAPRGLPHCTDIGCLVEEATGRCKRTVHAEVNAILNARVSVIGCTLYCTHHPCTECLPIIHNAGIAHVRYDTMYNGVIKSELMMVMDIQRYVRV